MRRLMVGLALALGSLAVSACSEVEVDTSSGDYQAVKLAKIAGSDVQRVTLPAEGVKRIGIRLGPIGGEAGRMVAPRAALIYDPEGKTWVYTSPAPLNFVRAAVEVTRVEGERVILSAGPPVGTQVVTVGAAEVYGAEFEVGH